jgi:hypothetical protein
MNKPLTLSQQQYLTVLNERVRFAQQLVAVAQQNLQSYVDDYLRDEHGAPPAAGWQIRDVQRGFEQPEVKNE